MASVRGKNSAALVSIFWAVLILASSSQSEAKLWNKIWDFFFPREVCRTTGCEEAAQNIIDNRDATVNPCVDFYEFTCGGWKTAHPVSPNETTRDTFKEATNRIHSRLRKILEEENEDDLESIKKARKVYHACLNSDPKQNMQVLLDGLADWGGWPIATGKWDESKFDWRKLLVNLIRTNGIYSLLSIQIDIDRQNTSKYIISIDMGNMLNCLEQMDEDTHWPTQESLVKLAQKLATAANQNITTDAMISDAIDMLHMDRDLCTPEKNNFTVYNPKTLKELQNFTDSNLGFSQQVKIDWVAFMKDLLVDSGIDINEDTPIMIGNPMGVLNSLLVVYKKSPRISANYMLWHKVAHFEKEIFDGFRTVDQEEYENVTNTAPRWLTCVGYTNEYMEHAIGYEYAKLYFQEGDKKRAKELFRHILDSFIKDLREIDWMNSETSSLAIDRANNMVTEVGYPDWYNDTNVEKYYKNCTVGDFHLTNLENLALARHIRNSKMLGKPLDPTLKFSNPATTNAFYLADNNAILIPAGIFQEPFYGNGRPEAMNYGGIGMLIGHEISHAFDDQDLLFGELGRHDLENRPTLLTYREKEQCLLRQYDQYPLPDEYKQVPKRNGYNTVGENIADNSGFQQAWKAYKRYVQENGSEKSLPGLEEYTPEQLFFIGFASVWCQSITPESLEKEIQFGEHSLKKLRTLIPLGNSEEFMDEWDCRPSDSKVTEKCTFW